MALELVMGNPSRRREMLLLLLFSLRFARGSMQCGADGHQRGRWFQSRGGNVGLFLPMRSPGA